MIATKKAQLATLIAELKKGQEEMEAGPLSAARGEELESKAKEAESLQADVDRYNRLAGLTGKSRTDEIDTILPKGNEIDMGDAPVGYLSLGKAFATSEEFRNYVAAGMPQQGSQKLQLPRVTDGGLVPLDRKHYEILQKAVPTIGASVIQPQQVTTGYNRTIAQAQLTIRDLVNNSGTNSNAVVYSVVTGFTRAAAPVAESGAKPESGMVVGTGTAPVRTLAVWMPVTEQQLQDVPQMENLIDTWLRWDLGRVEEDQMVWGAGTGENFAGIMNTAGVAAARTVGGDTFIDIIRRGITDIQIAGAAPNGVAVHPIDWETIQLTKATDNNYVWVVVRDATTNTDRIWGLAVTASVAMAEPGAYTTPARRILVGDFLRGATLWDKMEAALAVGYINAQFTSNQRTLRLEERAAFAVTMPLAFRYHQTQARVP